MTFSKLKLFALAGLFFSFAPAADAQEPSSNVDRYWVASFAGADVSPDAYYLYHGAIVALNRDLAKDGVVLRIFGGYGNYEYNESSVPGGVVDGDLRQFDVMLGYKATLAGFFATVYAGVDYQDHRLRPPDFTNVVSGSETGFKIAGDLESNRELSGLYLGLNGSYSTAFDSYWTRARVGYTTGRIVFGPEGILMGNEGYDGYRIGGFISFATQLNRWVPLELTLSAGHQSISDDDLGGSGGGTGMYGAVNFSVVF